MAKRVEEHWCDTFAKYHKVSCRFTKKDGVILRRIMRAFPTQAVSWMIVEFHRRQDDKYLENAGWSVAAFDSRAQGLYLRYVKRYGEPKAKAQQMELSQHLGSLGRIPRMKELLDKVEPEDG